MMAVLQEIMQTLKHFLHDGRVCVRIDRVIMDVLSELVTSNRDLNRKREPVLQISGGRAPKAEGVARAKVLSGSELSLLKEE